MKLSLILVLASNVSILVSGLVTRSPASTPDVPQVSAPKACKNPPVRKEWRDLSKSMRADYIKAVLCLTKRKAISGIEGAINRYDDFHAVHSSQTPNIHFVGHFALWHRLLGAAYEKALRDECGYKGAQPYWDWTLNSSKKLNSTCIFKTEIFDPKTGFGGNGPYVEATPEQNPIGITGRTGGGCVKDGPFREGQFEVHLPTHGCLKRDFVPWIMNNFTRPDLVRHVQSQKDFTSWARALEGEPTFDKQNIHGGGHFGIGGALGTMGSASDSPGDPLFYLHHANLDRHFAEWQAKDPRRRYNEVGGPIKPFDYGGQNVTLDFKINLGKLWPPTTLHKLLDHHGDTLCYTYKSLV